MVDWYFQCCLSQPSTTNLTEAYYLKDNKFYPDAKIVLKNYLKNMTGVTKIKWICILTV